MANEMANGISKEEFEDSPYVLVKREDLMRLVEHAQKLEMHSNIMREASRDVYYEIGDILNPEGKPDE